MPSSIKPVREDLLAGCVCGVTSVIVSHPLETLFAQQKMNLPATSRNIFHSMQFIYKRQGLVDGFYRGNLNLPLFSPAFVMSTQFFFYGQITRYLNKKMYNDEHTVGKGLLAGALTGFALTFIETPISLVNGQIEGHLYRRHTNVFEFHIRDCCKYIYESTGGLHGFYKGFFANLICSIPTSMFYFGGYEYMKRHLYEKHSRLFGGKREIKHVRASILLSGAVGGFCAYSICYPLDRIRFELQTDDLRRERRKYASFFDCVKQMYQNDNSIRTFYRGFLPGLLKAIPINATCFLAYEEVYRLLK